MYLSKEMIFSEKKFKVTFGMRTEEKQASTKDRKAMKKYMGESSSACDGQYNEHVSSNYGNVDKQK
jgi:hypothetical protein